MRLDRLLDSVGLAVLPAAICDLRQGVRLELPARSHAQLHCIVRGAGRLTTAAVMPLARNSLVLVPPQTQHTIEPEGGATRVLTLGAERGSDHIAALTAGSGESALLFITGRVQTIEQPPLGLFDDLPAPLLVELGALPHAVPPFAALLEEQQTRAPGNRRMIALLLQQCLLHGLRELAGHAACPLPWLRGLERTGAERR